MTNHASQRHIGRRAVAAGLALALASATCVPLAHADPQADLDAASARIEQLSAEVGALQDQLDSSTLVDMLLGSSSLPDFVARVHYATVVSEAKSAKSGDWKTSLDQLQVGDLVFPSTGHVGISIGNGQMIHAPYPGRTVCIASVCRFIGGGTY